MLNKKGYSMIEVIICLAMLAILSVSAFSLSSHIKYANTKKCVKELNQTLEKARMTSMSKAGDWKLYLYRQADGFYYELTNLSTLDKSQGKKLGGTSIQVFYKKKGDPSESQLGATGVMKICFSKSTGAYLVKDGSEIYESIRIANDSSKGYTIKLVEKTGKHMLQ